MYYFIFLNVLFYENHQINDFFIYNTFIAKMDNIFW